MVWRVHTGFNCFETVRKADALWWAAVTFWGLAANAWIMPMPTVAPKPDTIDRAALVEIVRRGGTLHGEQQAKPYANSAGQTDGLDNFKRETDIRLRGFFCVKLGRCRIPVACTYNFFPFFPDEGEFTYCPDCYCFPTCLPVPMLFPVPGFAAAFGATFTTTSIM